MHQNSKLQGLLPQQSCTDNQILNKHDIAHPLNFILYILSLKLEAFGYNTVNIA